MSSFDVLITCEHAENAVPDGVDLEVSASVLDSHLAYDRGAKAIAEHVARELGAPLHLGRFTRLFVDLNRREENPEVIVETTFGMIVEGNRRATKETREARIRDVHRPYRAGAQRDAVRLATEGGCFHLSIHSFEPAIDEDARDFSVGVLFDPTRPTEARIANALFDELRARGQATRLNEPYLGYPEGLTSWLREQIAEERYVGIEIEASYRTDTSRLAEDLIASVRKLVRP